MQHFMAIEVILFLQMSSNVVIMLSIFPRIAETFPFNLGPSCRVIILS